MVNNAGYDLGPQLTWFLSVSPPASAIGCFVVPGITILQMYRAKTTFSVPVLPFLSMATQCIVWLVYGFLKADNTLIVPNVIGAILGSAYCLVYNRYFPEPKRGLYTQFGIALGILGAVAVMLFTFPLTIATAIIGLGAAAGSVAFTASPLAAIWTVFRDQSLESMPLATSLVLFVNGILWTSYGIFVVSDMNIFVPNLLGTAAGSLQLLVHVYFGFCATKDYSEVYEKDSELGTSDHMQSVDVELT
mmetsp:Transcript_7753/g.12532  ORF Transcript_7753/g.12532 Transcript_7753/m.12532 type:complete len:247 (+) Transcript_7753:210-950(+)